MAIMRQMLPVLLGRLGKIPDPRNPKKLNHRLTVLLLYGILVFVFQRRAANAEITRPMFEHNRRNYAGSPGLSSEIWQKAEEAR
jgi:hypothetical protein